jgi:hypothetical protein
MVIPDYIDYQVFAKIVFPTSKNAVRRWRNKRNKIGRARFTSSDKVKIKIELIKLSEDLKTFADLID